MQWSPAPRSRDVDLRSAIEQTLYNLEITPSADLMQGRASTPGLEFRVRSARQEETDYIYTSTFRRPVEWCPPVNVGSFDVCAGSEECFGDRCVTASRGLV